jgi:hypothetical protein
LVPIAEFRKSTVAAVALLSGAIAMSCGGKRQAPPVPDGMLSLALTLPTGVTISSVSYTIHSAQPTSPPADKNGSINTSNSMATASVETSYPASTADTVSLTATTSDGEPCTGTSSQFAVVSNGQALVGVTLTCGLLTPDGGAGSVRVNATIVDNSDICPVLNAWSVSPLTTGRTGTIDVSSMASDGNAGDTLTYKWTASPAPATDPFTNSNAAATTFNCPTPTPFALTITVDDHHMPTNCRAARTVNVACGLCGNGVIDPGEQCDSAAQFLNNCCDPTTCQIIPDCGGCGNGIVSPGEQCDSAAAFANNTCAGPAGVTVDNVPGPGTHVIPACQNIPIVCGNGLVQPGEQCDAGPTGGPMCSTSCIIITTCLTCEQTGMACLATQVTATSPFGCAGLTAAAQTSCNNLHTCLDQNPNCSNPANVAPPSTDPTACFCGALDAATCAGTAAASINGPCAASYFAVYGGVSTANRDSILGDFFNKATATGMADNLYSCDVTKMCIGGMTLPQPCP